MKKIIISCLFLTSFIHVHSQQKILVSPASDVPTNSDQLIVTKDINSALEAGIQSAEPNIIIYLRGGIYRLTQPIQIHSSQWKNKSLLITAYENEQVTLCGGPEIDLHWSKYQKGIWKSPVAIRDFDQLYLNHTPRILARYPNYNTKQILNGSSSDALSPERVKKWKNPAGGYIHALHQREWGGMHYRITGKKQGKLIYEGGFQNNRPSKMHPQFRYVENIFEELDAPGEWFLDKEKGILYYYPYPNEDFQESLAEVSCLPELIRITGTPTIPVQNITISRLRFTQTSRTFMDTYEPLLRSDWQIHRGAAVFIENADNCHVINCDFYALGGNALFFSKYNQSCSAQGNHIHQIGASAICFVGDTSAVRSALFRYHASLPYAEIDQTPGPKNNFYPRQCTAENNLIHDIGQIEKQVAGIQIQIASEINVRHNTIYSTPRAAINIGDGAFGGHLLEYNDAFNTVLETGDHGTFNSWGRDRFWQPSYAEMSKRVAEHPDLILLDACYTTTIRNNRFRCDHGWDIDLDDGSSNYHIYNNLCLQGGIKLREGFYRTVENNIIINNSLHPHVWFANSGDVIQRNIFHEAYKPIQLQGWGKKVDYNFFSDQEALLASQKQKTDGHSIAGNPYFKNPAIGDFTILPGSQAFEIGFVNFPQDRFGVYSPRLKKIASQPEIPALHTASFSQASKEYVWLKSKVRPVRGLGDRSAFGLPDEKGVVILEIAKDSPLQSTKIKAGDILRQINDHQITSMEDLLNLTKKYQYSSEIKLGYFRDQQFHTVLLKNIP